MAFRNPLRRCAGLNVQRSTSNIQRHAPITRRDFMRRACFLCPSFLHPVRVRWTEPPRTPSTFFPTNINKVETRCNGTPPRAAADGSARRRPARWRCPGERCPMSLAHSRSCRAGGSCCGRGVAFSSGCIPDIAGTVPRPARIKKSRAPYVPERPPASRPMKFPHCANPFPTHS